MYSVMSETIDQLAFSSRPETSRLQLLSFKESMCCTCKESKTVTEGEGVVGGNET